MEIIFRNDWMKIKNIHGKYFIQYNSGDLINSTKEIEVSKIDAENAMTDEIKAYKIILKYQNLQNAQGSDM